MNVVRSSAVIASLTLVSRVFGLARDLVLAAALGAGPVADAFTTALQLPNAFRRLFAEGAFSQAFIPYYAKTLAKDGPEAADRLASQALSVLLPAVLIVTALAALFAPQINYLLFYGYRNNREIFDLATLLTRITMPYLAAMSLATLFGGLLNARGRFVLAAAAQSALNVTMLLALTPVLVRLLAPKAAGWLPDWSTREASIVAAAAVTFAGGVQAALVWFGVRRQKVRLQAGAPRFTPEVRHLLVLAVPGAIAGGAFQINVLISQSLASLEVGAKTVLSYADRLYQLPLALVGIAIGVAMLPKLSRLVRSEDHVGARAALDEAVALSLAFAAPASVAFLVAPFWIIEAVFARGAFSVEDAHATALALFHYAWGLPAFVLAKIYAPAFFARGDTRTPMRFALFSMALNISLGAALFFGLRSQGLPGFGGLAVATSLAAWLNVGLMVRTLAKQKAYAPSPAALGRLARLLLASAAMGAVVWVAQSQRGTIEALLKGKEGSLAVVVVVGMLAFVAFAFAFQAVRLSELRAAFRRDRSAPDQSTPPDPA